VQLHRRMAFVTRHAMPLSCTIFRPIMMQQLRVTCFPIWWRWDRRL